MVIKEKEMLDRGYIINANGAEIVSCKKEAEAIWMVLSLRKAGHTANMRRDNTKEFIPVSDLLVSDRRRHADMVA